MWRRDAPLSGALFKKINIHDLFLHSITSQLTTMNLATSDECTCKSVFFLLACSVLTFILNSLWSFFLGLFQVRRVTVVVSVFLRNHFPNCGPSQTSFDFDSSGKLKFISNTFY